jgi:hypothetical protein
MGREPRFCWLYAMAVRLPEQDPLRIAIEQMLSAELRKERAKERNSNQPRASS